MAYNPNELAEQGSDLGPLLRYFADEIKPKTFAPGTGTIPVGAAVTFNTSTEKYQIWKGSVNEVNTITAASTAATDGTFTLTVNGQTTAAIDHDADAAAIQAALEALSNVAVGDVSVEMTTGTDLGDNNAVATISWDGLLQGQDITITANFAGLTGNAHVLATATAGGAAEANGTNLLKGFAWPDAIVLDDTDDVLGQVMLRGEVHIDDVPLVAGSYGLVELQVALRSGARELGIRVQGLDKVR